MIKFCFWPQYTGQVLIWLLFLFNFMVQMLRFLINKWQLCCFHALTMSFPEEIFVVVFVSSAQLKFNFGYHAFSGSRVMPLFTHVWSSLLMHAPWIYSSITMSMIFVFVTAWTEAPEFRRSWNIWWWLKNRTKISSEGSGEK